MSPARRFLNAMTLTLVIGVLGGCFRSDKPLIDKAQAAFPFEELTVRTEEKELAVLRKTGDAYVFLDPEKAAAGTSSNEKAILLHQVADGLYIVQEAGERGHATYLFAKREGSKINVSSVCRSLDDTTLAKLGIVRESVGGAFADCVAQDLKSLTELAKMPVLWANETKTLEIVSIK